jgi:hypothetical protein
MLKTRMPFNGECITTSKFLTSGWTFFGRTSWRPTVPRENIGRFEGIALTRATRQVVLWSDHETAVIGLVAASTR